MDKTPPSERPMLLTTIPSTIYNYAMRELKRMRTEFPAYRDDQLFMKLYCDLLQKAGVVPNPDGGVYPEMDLYHEGD